MNRPALVLQIALSLSAPILLVACAGKQSAPTPAPAPAPAPAPQPVAAAAPIVRAKSPVEAGRYLVLVGGCNDCHTPGFAESGGTVSEATWLTGNPVGFRGPWGVTYPPNLRLSLKDMKVEDWVTIARHRKDKPPMPWSQLHAMSDADLRAVYAYVKSLPVTGRPAPEYVPPGKEPTMPYFDFVPKNLPAAASASH